LAIFLLKIDFRGLELILDGN